MARLGSWDTIGYAPTWFDVDNDTGGWWDRDLIPNKTGPGPTPWYSSLLYMGGWDDTSDRFFASSTVASNEELDLEAGIAWELGLLPYRRQVSIEQFEERILTAQRDTARRAKFTQMVTFFGEEREAKARLVKRVAAAAGVTYVLWRILLGL
jgi:hypothetical protein